MDAFMYMNMYLNMNMNLNMHLNMNGYGKFFNAGNAVIAGASTSGKTNSYGSIAKDNTLMLMSPATEAQLKAPLKHSWTFWYFDNDRTLSWSAAQKNICTIHTAEDFWCLVKYFVPPSKLGKGCDYSLFREGVIPMWEDPANKDGGRWMFLLKSADKDYLDQCWIDLCLMLISESCFRSDQIRGIVISNRHKFCKLSIWTADRKNTTAIQDIGLYIRDVFGLLPGCLQYSAHRGTVPFDDIGFMKPLYIL